MVHSESGVYTVTCFIHLLNSFFNDNINMKWLQLKETYKARTRLIFFTSCKRALFLQTSNIQGENFF